MTWTRTKPTKPGLYRWRYNNQSAHRAVRVREIGPKRELWADGGDLGRGLLREWRGQWSTEPIPEPEDRR